MDPELLKYLADMTPEQLMEAIRTGQLAGTSGIQPVPPATPGSPWQPGVGLKVTEGQPIPMAAIREAAQFGDAKTAIRPSVSGAGAPPPVRMQLPESSSSLSAVRPKPFGLEDLISSDRPVPGAGTPAPAAPLRSLPIPELPGEPLPAPRGPSAPAPIAAAGAPVRPAVPAPAAPTSMPQLPGISGISQVEGAFGAGPSAQADAWRQYLAGKGGQPGLAGAASGAGMGAPVPPPSAASLPGAGAGMPPPPPPSAGASPGAGIPGGQRLSQADEAMLRMRAAAAESAQFAAKEPGLLARGAGAVGRGLSRVAPPLTAAYVAGNAAKGGMDAYDPQASALANVGNVAGGAASAGGGAAWAVRPTPMNILFGGGLAEMDDPNFKLGGIAGAAKGLYDWATAPKQEAGNQFAETQPGTSATIRAAMSGGQSRPQDFDMDADGSPPGQSMVQEKAEYGPAPVRPKTNGAARPGAARPGSGKGATGAPAIPPSQETGVSNSSSGPGTSPYKLLGESLSVPLLDKMAVRPGGAPSPTPTGSWRDKGYTAMLNDKRGVVGEGRRLPLGAGPGEGARHLLAGEGNTPPAPLSLGQPQVPDASQIPVRPSTRYSTFEGGVGQPIGAEDMQEDEEDKRARLARSGSKRFASYFADPIFR